MVDGFNSPDICWSQCRDTSVEKTNVKIPLVRSLCLSPLIRERTKSPNLTPQIFAVTNSCSTQHFNQHQTSSTTTHSPSYLDRNHEQQGQTSSTSTTRNTASPRELAQPYPLHDQAGLLTIPHPGPPLRPPDPTERPIGPAPGDPPGS